MHNGNMKSEKEFEKILEEARMDPQFMEAIDEFIDITTNRVYRLRNGKIEFLD